MHQGEASKGNAALCQAAGASGLAFAVKKALKKQADARQTRQTWGSGCDSSPSLELTAVGLGRTGTGGVPSTAAFGPMQHASVASPATEVGATDESHAADDCNQAAARHVSSSPRTIPAFNAAGPQAAAKLIFGAATTARSESPSLQGVSGRTQCGRIEMKMSPTAQGRLQHSIPTGFYSLPPVVEPPDAFAVCTRRPGRSLGLIT
jgi:hypothetical protein